METAGLGKDRSDFQLFGCSIRNSGDAPASEMVIPESKRGFLDGKRKGPHDVTGSHSSYEPDQFHSQASFGRLGAIMARSVRPAVVGPIGKAARFGTRSRKHAQ